MGREGTYLWVLEIFCGSKYTHNLAKLQDLQLFASWHESMKIRLGNRAVSTSREERKYIDSYDSAKLQSRTISTMHFKDRVGVGVVDILHFFASLRFRRAFGYRILLFFFAAAALYRPQLTP